MGHAEATLSDVELAVTATTDATSTVSAKIEIPPLQLESSSSSDDSDIEPSAVDSSDDAVASSQDKEAKEAQQLQGVVAAAAAASSWGRRAWDFYTKQEFLILVVLAIPLARLYPQLGAYYLHPKYTATWLAVSFIFFLSGLSLRWADLQVASLNMRYNLSVLMFNFLVVSSIVFGISRLLSDGLGWISSDLADGLTLCGCLPVTVNMAIVLSEAAGADRAAAVFVTVASNLSGVFLSPLLIVLYLGTTNNAPVWVIFWKLALRVIVPMCIGQVVRATFASVRAWVAGHKRAFKRAQQYLLIYIIYTIFCRVLKGGADNSVGSILLVLAVNFLQLTGLMTLAWFTLKVLYPNQPKLRVTGLFGCTHKTISIGVPLITAIYGSQHPNIGLYTLPILIWHPMQLIVGTLIMPRLQAFIQREEERLGISDDQSNSSSPSNDICSDTGDCTPDSTRGINATTTDPLEMLEEGLNNESSVHL
jgi:solute carrier family 10 (sodium/bile acid cotransporter), member 7